MLTPTAGAGALAGLIAQSARIVAFTGAGISTESGVPDFRSKDSPWMRHKPIDFAAFRADPAQRAEAWRRKFAMDDLYADAAPSRGHFALARLLAEGRLLAIVTQNIDGLHQAAGASADKVIELHGNGTYAACLDCHKRHELTDIRRAFVRDGAAPACGCGGIVKSATISFGQAMPAPALQRAQALCEACDLMLVLGSSLVVQPAARLPLVAVRAGARLAIVNNEPTPLDPYAGLVVRGDIGDALQDLAG